MRILGDIRKYRAVSYAAILGMLFQAFLVVFHVPAQALAKAGLSGKYKSFVICTAQGVQTITFGTNEPPSENAPSTTDPCPICLSFTGNSNALDFMIPSGSGIRGISSRIISEPQRITDRTPAISHGHDPPV